MHVARNGGARVWVIPPILVHYYVITLLINSLIRLSLPMWDINTLFNPLASLLAYLIRSHFCATLIHYFLLIGTENQI